MNARQLHRGTMAIGALLMAYWVISGLTIALIDATDPHQAWADLGGGPGARLDAAAHEAGGVPPPFTLAKGIAKALTTAAAAHLRIASVDYRMSGHGHSDDVNNRDGDIARLELAAADGSRDTELRFYAESGTAMTPLVADGDPFHALPVYAQQRERIKSLHKGDAVGFAGQFLGLLTGVIVIVMAASGITLYARLWNTRRKSGKSAVFWKGRESLWRRLHRTVAIVLALFVLNKAVTGTILAWGEIQVQLAIHHLLPFPYPMPTPMPPYSEAPLPGDLLRELQASYEAATKQAPSARVVAIDLVHRDATPEGLVTLGGSESRTLVFDLRTGAALDDPARRGIQVGNGYFTDWHQVVKRMHRGDIIGRFTGRYADIACAVALLYLVISGCVLYGQMLKLRVARGLSGMFWR